MKPLVAFDEQDLGELSPTIREAENVRVSRDVTMLYPDNDTSHGVVMEKIRDVLEQHYSEYLNNLANADERVIITRVILDSDDLPVVEYGVVEKNESSP